MTGRPLSRDDYLDAVEIKQIRKMLTRKTAWKSKTGYDDLLIFEIFVQTGLRRAELCALTVADVETDGDRPTIKVRSGKGSKPRVVDISKQLAKQISDYLDTHRPCAESDEPLIANRNRTHIGLSIMSNKVRKWGRMMARRYPENRRWPLLHTHTLRHTFATNALFRGLPLTWVSDMLGHSNLATTSVYVHVVDRYRQSYADAMSDSGEPHAA